LIRRLYDLGLQEQDIRNLYRFIDWVMILPKSLENQLCSEVQQLEQERTMRYITSAEHIGYERGREEGKEEGRQEGRQAGELGIILKLLKRRLGELPPEIQQLIQSLSVNQLENLSEALLDFRNLTDLVNWLESN
jgi:predicted transposase YdaD